MPQPPWLDRLDYPFQSRALTTPSGDMHYVDEGTGEVIVFVHGNPTWSFLYRHLIKAMRSRYRCVAPDNIGFGLSHKPADAAYTPRFHSQNLTRFIEALGLRDITLVLHDWGGAIGMGYALEHPENVKRLIVFNNSFWSLRGVKGAERFSAIVGSRPGRFVVRAFNAFPRFVIPGVFGDRSKLSKSAHRHYIKPFPTPGSREGMWVLAKAIIGESDWLDTLWQKRQRLADKPVLIVAGLKDPTFGPEKLARWQETFPLHVTVTYPDIGHFVPEELGEEAVKPVMRFLEER